MPETEFVKITINHGYEKMTKKELIEEIERVKTTTFKMMAEQREEISKLEHTKKCLRGQLVKLGFESRRFHQRSLAKEHQIDGLLQTNGRLARAFIDSSEILWTIAGIERKDKTFSSLKHQARNLLAQRVREADLDIDHLLRLSQRKRYQ